MACRIRAGGESIQFNLTQPVQPGTANLWMAIFAEHRPPLRI